MKKILAIALSVLMIVSVLPFAAFATDKPAASVTALDAAEITNLSAVDLFNNMENITLSLEVGYKFTALDDANTVEESPYANWIADYVIYTDKDVDPSAVTLAGQYGDYPWVAITSPDTFEAKPHELRLLAEVLGQTNVTYRQVCTTVNDFYCGAVMNDDSAIGTKMTVELRLYNPNDDTDYVVVNKFDYTFGANDVVPEAHAIKLDASELSVKTKQGTLDLDVGYKFVAADTPDTIDAFAANNKYATCPADFVIKSDDEIPAGAVTLAGFYAQANSEGNWETLTSDGNPVNFRLLASGVLGEEYTFNYVDIVNLVGTFYCGAKANNASAAGKTVTVELRLFPAGEDSILVDSFSYTFKAPAAPASDVLPGAEAIALEADELTVPTANGELQLDAGYKFVTDQTKDTIAAFAANNKYANCPIDFVIKTDEVIPAGAVTLAGFYAHHDANWVTFDSDAAGTNYRLLKDIIQPENEFTYVDIVNYVGEFFCGVKLNDPAAIGTKITVELRVFPEGNAEGIEIASFSYILNDAENFQSMTAKDHIDYNAYLDIDSYIEATEKEADQFYLEVEYNAYANINEWTSYKTVTKAVTDEDVLHITEGDNAGYYEVKIPVAPSQINEPIILKLYVEGEADPLYTATTSVYELCLKYIGGNYPAKLQNFCKAMIDYARAAQISFKYADVIDIEGAGENGFYNPEVTTLPALAGRPGANDLDLGGLAVTGYSFTCKADSEANILFSNSDVTAVASNGGTFENSAGRIKVKGIAPAEVNDLFEVELSNGRTLKLALSNILNFYVVKGTVVDDQNLARALYLYGVAAKINFS